jgi:flagellar biosynthesis protein FlhF
MKITRHTARDMRAALRKVREQLGPEAVILTSKRMPFGVEVTAAIDFDAATVESQAQGAEPVAEAVAQAPAGRAAAPAANAAAAAHARAALAAHGVATAAARQSASASQPQKFQPEEFASLAPRDEEDDDSVQLSPFARLQAEMLQARPVRTRNGEVKAVQSPAPARAVQKPVAEDFEDVGEAGEVSEDVQDALESAIDSYLAGDGIEGSGNADFASPTRPKQNPSRPTVRATGSGTSGSGATSSANASIEDEDSEESALSLELKAMRRILETQMAQLAWNDLSRRAPIHTEILRELTEVGLTQEFAAQIVAQLPVGTDLIKARRLSISLIAQRLNVIGDRWLDKGGHIALVGPTGVGKTTALAKLAVRWVLRHGARSLALISADGVRIGAHDQLQALGQMLDVPVCIAESLTEIPRALDHLAQKRLVLIDTPGMSQRDSQLAERMAQLSSPGSNVETALVLSASTQAGAIAETVARFSTAKIASVLLTKVDEAASLGGILSILARAELPISYVSEGQRVPEDLRPARALELVSAAVNLAKSSGAAADEDLLRRRYGEVAHALA